MNLYPQWIINHSLCLLYVKLNPLKSFKNGQSMKIEHLNFKWFHSGRKIIFLWKGFWIKRNIHILFLKNWLLKSSHLLMCICIFFQRSTYLSCKCTQYNYIMLSWLNGYANHWPAYFFTYCIHASDRSLVLTQYTRVWDLCRIYTVLCCVADSCVWRHEPRVDR